jgi:transposase
VCIVDGNGNIACEGKIGSEPDDLIAWLRGRKLELTGLEAGPLSQWLYAAMRQAGLAVELLETLHVRHALKTMLAKSDRNDARATAQLMRLGRTRKPRPSLAIPLDAHKVPVDGNCCPAAPAPG